MLLQYPTASACSPVRLQSCLGLRTNAVPMPRILRRINVARFECMDPRVGAARDGNRATFEHPHDNAVGILTRSQTLVASYTGPDGCDQSSERMICHGEQCESTTRYLASVSSVRGSTVKCYRADGRIIRGNTLVSIVG